MASACFHSVQLEMWRAWRRCEERSFGCRAVWLIVVLLAACGRVPGSKAKALNETTVDSVLELFIPTVHSRSATCREQSEYYLEQLKQLTLWATEMFDASAKFPDGLLSGSGYHMGDFDECLDIVVPYTDHHEFKGKYCLVEVSVGVSNVEKQFSIDWEQDSYRKYFNVSVNRKLTDYSKTLLRAKRNTYRLAFCFPSSCTHDDLKEGLNVAVAKENIGNFKLNFNVEEQDCQTKDDQPGLTTGDNVFIYLLVTYIFFISGASVYYNYASKQSTFNKYGTFNQFLRCLAIGPNTRKLFTAKCQDADGLVHLSGIKIFSIVLVICGHRAMFMTGSPILNPKFLEQLYYRTESMALANATILIDSFLSIGGFLAAFIILQKTAESKKINFVTIYLHRLLRLLPPYIVVVAFYSTVFNKMGSGPLWKERIGVERDRCVNSWWANLLFISNLVNTDKICMFQTWYIDCDMQLFLIAPFIIWIYLKRPRIGLILTATLIGISVLIHYIIIYVNSYDPILMVYMSLLKDPVVSETFVNVYIPSYLRGSSYFTGMLAGLLKYKIREKGYKMSKKLVFTGWTLSFVAMLGVIYSAQTVYVFEPNQKNEMYDAWYSALSRLTWSLGISWMVLAISEGHAGIIKPLTAWKPFIVLNRLTYSAFLVHGAFQLYAISTIRSPFYINTFIVFGIAFGDVVWSYLMGYVLCILFESPVLQLESLFLGKKKISSREETNYKDIQIEEHITEGIKKDVV